MSAIFTIAKKEYRDFFYSPIAYVFTSVFLFLAFWVFFANFFPVGQASLRFFFGWIPVLFLLLLPSITMSRWAEEKKTGTLEILLTLPLNDHQIVLGKFLATLMILATILLTTTPVCFTLSMLGDLDYGPVIGGYLGLFFMGAACLSIGLFLSSLTENQIIAFVTAVVTLLLLYLLGEIIVLNYIPESLRDLVAGISLSTHFQSIARGVIDSQDIIYYLSLTGFFLYLNILNLGSRKWQ